MANITVVDDDKHILYGDYIEEDAATPTALREDMQLLAEQVYLTFKQLPTIHGKCKLGWYLVVPKE